MERNNTSFPKLNYEILNKIAKSEKDPLRYHQRVVYEFVLKTAWVRGILIYHQMGAGKSILGNSICEGLLEKDIGMKVIFMAAKSLHNNFKESIAKFRKMKAEKEGTSFSEEKTTEHINANYEFISLNASNMITQVHKAIKKDVGMDVFKDNAITDDEAEEFAKIEQFGNLDNTCLVIDEAHNLFNSISNGSRNAVGLYELIMKAKNIKVIFLTGSPIVNDPFELAICMNMISGPIGRHTLFGEDYMDFSKYFISAKPADKTDDVNDLSAPINQSVINHRDKFINRIVGLVSYYGADDASQKKLYPEQLETIVERIPMSGRQYAAYITARDRELEETQRGSKFSGPPARVALQKPQGMSSSYRVRSRQLSNFLFPNYASKSYKDSKGYLKYEKYIDKINDINLTDLAYKGSDEDKMGLEIWSPKILKMMHNIQSHCPFSFISSKPTKPKTKEKVLKIPAKKGGKEAAYVMERKDIPEAIELYRKIFGESPDVDFTDECVKVYLSKTTIGVIKPGYASLNKQRGHTNYLVNIGTTGDQKDMTKILKAIKKDHPKIYLKLDRSKERSDTMKTFYESKEFYVYRASDGYWYLRHILGSDEEQTIKASKTKGGFGPGLIYSQFIDSGVALVGRVLKAHGFVEIKDINDALKHKKGAAFAIISGQVDPDLRSELVKIFNSVENNKGEHLAILLVTATGAEGLDLKAIRHEHILEPYWHMARIKQIIARAVRMGSHLSLPEKERNVQPYIYLSDYPPSSVINKLEDVEHIRKQMAKEDTTDVNLYKKSVNNQRLIDSFLIAAQEAAVDCPIHYKNKDCRICAPTDEPLFINDLDKDIKAPSRCRPLKESNVKAKSIMIDDKEFMYSVDSEKHIHIYEHVPSLDAYDEVFENHAFYNDLEKAIKKREKIH